MGKACVQTQVEKPLRGPSTCGKIPALRWDVAVLIHIGLFLPPQLEETKRAKQGLEHKNAQQKLATTMALITVMCS